MIVAIYAYATVANNQCYIRMILDGNEVELSNYGIGGSDGFHYIINGKGFHLTRGHHSYKFQARTNHPSKSINTYDGQDSFLAIL